MCTNEQFLIPDLTCLALRVSYEDSKERNVKFIREAILKLFHSNLTLASPYLEWDTSTDFNNIIPSHSYLASSINILTTRTGKETIFASIIKQYRQILLITIK